MTVGAMTICKPAVVAGMAFRNRLASAAATRGMAAIDGTPTEEMAVYYQRIARNGLGLVITEATYVPGEEAQTYFGQPGIANPGHMEAWKRIVGVVKGEGARIVVQLQHAGPLREPGLGPAAGAVERVPAVPSWQRQQAYFETRNIAREEVQRLVEDFEAAAALANEAGFDGVEVHCSRGYLLDDFLRDTNDRDDEFGGSLENRLRFPAEVAKAVRRQIGDKLLSYNLSLYKMDEADYQPKDGADGIRRVVATLAAHGVSVFHVTTRGIDRCRVGEAMFLDFVRGATKCAVIGGGGIRSLEQAEAAIQQGRCDIVSMARLLIANPDILTNPDRASNLRRYKRGMERVPAIRIQ